MSHRKDARRKPLTGVGSNDLKILRVKVISLICIATAHDLDHRAEHDRQIEVEVATSLITSLAVPPI